MTPEQFTAQLPTLTCNPLPAKPPFVFNGLSSRVFPLRASLDALQRFCNGYLNFVPESFGRFRASLPYVFLSVLDYGQVGEASGLGWFSQVEVFFAVPLEWYRFVDGRWVFHDWATITPFIYVDDNFSVPLGRTVSGFPKVLAKVTAAPSAWINNPLGPVSLARVETDVFPTAYAGQRMERRVFLEIDRAAPMSNLRVPFNTGSPMAPWTIASQLANAAGGLSRDAQWLAQAMRISTVNPLSQPDLLTQMLGHIAPGLKMNSPGFVTHSINLKQFRSTHDLDSVCYQALTDGPMTINSFQAGGLLGEDQLLLGDATGGHVIRLHEYPNLPIAQQLGLEVQRRWRDGEVSVAEIAPVAPFWMQTNVSLLPSVNLGWRTEDGVWRDGAGQPMPAAHPEPSIKDTPPKNAPLPRFNTMVASALEAVTGPFEFSGTNMRVLPLLADRQTLQHHLDEMMNNALANKSLQESPTDTHSPPAGVRLRVWSRPKSHEKSAVTAVNDHGDVAYVYMAATSFGRVTSESNNIGDWAKYELSFLVPVCWERQTKRGWEVEGVGMVPAFFFVDDCKTAITRYEVQGIDARTANFVRPESVWLSDQPNDMQPQQVLLRVEAETWSALDAGQQAHMQPLVEIVQNEVNAGLGTDNFRDNATRWSQILRDELLSKKKTAQSGKKTTSPEAQDPCKTARALALELLGNQAPFSLYSLMQFRDVVDPDKACYQALVRVQRTIKELYDLSEIEETLVVRIHDYPKLNIVKQLGLIGTRESHAKTGIVYNVQAVRPFTLRAKLSESLSERLAYRCGTHTWSMVETDPAQGPDAFIGRLGSAEHGPKIQATLNDETVQDRADPSDMALLMALSRKIASQKAVTPISPAQARTTVKTVDPQVIIESILSREWGNTHPHARWRQGRATLEQALQQLPQGADVHTTAQVAMYKRMLMPFMRHKGFVPKLDALYKELVHAEHGNPKIADITQKRHAFEAAFDDYERFLSARHTSKDAGTLTTSHTQNIEIAKHTLVESLRDIDDKLMPKSLGDLPRRPDRAQEHLYRLKELLNFFPKITAKGSTDPTSEHPATMVAASDILTDAARLREAVTSARHWCDAIEHAIRDALARAYQKPDFCIRRDAVGSYSNQLLATTWSWDEGWYRGRADSEATGPQTSDQDNDKASS